MQIDIGFGDIIYPIPEKSFMPTILNLPAPDCLLIVWKLPLQKNLRQ
ncbi:hypothetical protein [Legionella clemsonensis]|nr:hypothetical protein [Legionella clemsonensis]